MEYGEIVDLLRRGSPSIANPEFRYLSDPRGAWFCAWPHAMLDADDHPAAVDIVDLEAGDVGRTHARGIRRR